MSGAKITGELLWDVHAEAAAEANRYGSDFTGMDCSFEQVDEEVQETYNRLAKKLEDYLKYGKRSSK